MEERTMVLMASIIVAPHPLRLSEEPLLSGSRSSCPKANFLGEVVK
jgi:hypothetical protein